MLELLPLARSVLFAVLFAGIEYRYINRKEVGWKDGLDQEGERPAFWVISPYQLYLLFPIFIVVGFSASVSAWVANTFAIALLEDVAYFVWRRAWVKRGEWTTLMFGSFEVAGKAVPAWWPLALTISLACYLMPL